MRRIKLAAHLTTDEVGQRYRQAHDPVARSQWQILWLLAQGQRSEQVVAGTGYGIDWIRAIARRYNRQGPPAVGDQRHHNPGKRLKLPVEQQATLQELLSQAAARGEAWTGRQVADWMAEQLGQFVYPQRGWEMLRRLGFTSKVPRPRHVKAAPEMAEVFKKT